MSRRYPDTKRPNQYAVALLALAAFSAVGGGLAHLVAFTQANSLLGDESIATIASIVGSAALNFAGIAFLLWIATSAVIEALEQIAFRSDRSQRDLSA